MSKELDVVLIDKPFDIEELPLKSVYVLDNWLCDSLHHYFDHWITTTQMWAKTNQVNSHSKTGLPHHSFWGTSFFRNDFEVEHGIEKENTFFVKYIIRRLQTEFNFKWTRFQYAGMNSQTVGLHGTTHSDCADSDDWNLSFLYYTNRYWNPKWGGKLRLYDKIVQSPEHDGMMQGLYGRKDHIKNYQIAEVDFKPNRLIMFDGRIPHGADAPNENAKYMDRRSLVIRGDEVRLIKDKKEFYNANDRVHLL